MLYRLIYFCLLTAIFAAAGCSSVSQNTALPEPRLLGRELTANSKNIQQIEIKEPSGNLSLQEALSLALVKNPELKAFSWEMRASEAMKLQAGLLPNPEIEFEIGEFDSEGTGFDTAETAIILSQLVELGGKRHKRLAVAKLESGLIGWDYEAKRLDVFVETTQAFIDVLAAQKSVVLATEAVSLAAKVHAAVGERVKAGKVTPLEESRAGVELSMSKIGLERSKKELEASRTRLGAKWGNSKPSFTEVTGKFETVLDSIPSIRLFEGDLAQNPDIARWETEMDFREATIALEQSASIPDLVASAGVQQFEATGEDALTFGVAFTLPFFDRNQGGIQAARYRLSKADEERRSAKLKVQSDLADAYRDLTMFHLETMTLQKEILAAAQRTFEAASDGYQQGKFGYLEVLDAQRTMFEVREKYVESLSAYHKAVVTLERLIGRPIKADKYEIKTTEKN